MRLYGLAVQEINRRNMMLMSGLGLLGAGALAAPGAQAQPARPQAPVAPLPAEPPGAAPSLLFFDEFDGAAGSAPDPANRSEEHTSELQSRGHLVCRLLLENK